MTTDHRPYIEAVRNALEAAGLPVGSWRIGSPAPRTGSIELKDRDSDHVVTLYWDERHGWEQGDDDTPEGLDGVGIVDPPAIVLAALLRQSWTARQMARANVPDDEESALAAYAPTVEPKPDPRGPRCGSPCPSRAHACDRDPGHLGFHRDVQQKGTEACSWEEAR